MHLDKGGSKCAVSIDMRKANNVFLVRREGVARRGREKGVGEGVGVEVNWCLSMDLKYRTSVVHVLFSFSMPSNKGLPAILYYTITYHTIPIPTYTYRMTNSSWLSSSWGVYMGM